MAAAGGLAVVQLPIALGQHQGRKEFTLQTLLPAGSLEGSCARVAKVSGFSLHAGVAAEAHKRYKLERLCRYITRPALSEQCISLTTQGWVTSSRARTVTALRMWYSKRWISSHASRPRSPDLG
jgi:hypothetical protein